MKFLITQYSQFSSQFHRRQYFSHCPVYEDSQSVSFRPCGRPNWTRTLNIRTVTLHEIMQLQASLFKNCEKSRCSQIIFNQFNTRVVCLLANIKAILSVCPCSNKRVWRHWWLLSLCNNNNYERRGSNIQSCIFSTTPVFTLPRTEKQHSSEPRMPVCVSITGKTLIFPTFIRETFCLNFGRNIK
jgi:hypothetical protein